MSLEKISIGSFSSVYTVKKQQYFGFKGEDVVLKRNLTETGNSLMNCSREMDVLIHNRHPFITKLLHIVHCTKFDNDGSMSPVSSRRGMNYREDDAHFVFPRASEDLTSVIQRAIPPRHAQLLSCQILLALEFLHSRGIMHRDIKPANVLFFPLNREKGKEVDEERVYRELVDPSFPYWGTVRLSDFGFAKFHTPREPNTPGMVTSWYRAPENCRNEYYDYGVDVWAAGCVIYELFFRRSLFSIPTDSPRQNEAILHAINVGHPDSSFTLRPPSFLARSGMKEPAVRDLCNQIRVTPETFEGVFRGMLHQDKFQRCSVTTILDSPFFSSFHRYIDHYRRSNTPRLPLELSFVEGSERSWIVSLMSTLFEKKNTYPYMTTRIIFHIVLSYYRFLAHLAAKETPSGVETEHCGKYMTKKRAQEVWSILTVIILNYHTNLHNPTPLHTFFPFPLSRARQWEVYLHREVFQKGIYQDTPYEEIDALNLEFEEIDEFGLLIYYSRGPVLYSDNRQIVEGYLAVRELMYPHLYNYFTSAEKASSLLQAIETCK